MNELKFNMNLINKFHLISINSKYLLLLYLLNLSLKTNSKIRGYAVKASKRIWHPKYLDPTLCRSIYNCFDIHQDSRFLIHWDAVLNYHTNVFQLIKKFKIYDQVINYNSQVRCLGAQLFDKLNMASFLTKKLIIPS